MKRLHIVIASLALLCLLLAGCASTQPKTDEGSVVRSKLTGSAEEEGTSGHQIRSKMVGENTDVSVHGDTGAE